MNTIQVTPQISKVLKSMDLPTSVKTIDGMQKINNIILSHDNTLITLCVGNHMADSWDIEPEDAKKLSTSRMVTNLF